jgi:hypothetical protein
MSSSRDSDEGYQSQVAFKKIYAELINLLKNTDLNKEQKDLIIKIAKCYLLKEDSETLPNSIAKLTKQSYGEFQSECQANRLIFYANDSPNGDFLVSAEINRKWTSILYTERMQTLIAKYKFKIVRARSEDPDNNDSDDRPVKKRKTQSLSTNQPVTNTNPYSVNEPSTTTTTTTTTSNTEEPSSRQIPPSQQPPAYSPEFFPIQPFDYMHEDASNLQGPPQYDLTKKMTMHGPTIKLSNAEQRQHDIIQNILLTVSTSLANQHLADDQIKLVTFIAKCYILNKPGIRLVDTIANALKAKDKTYQNDSNNVCYKIFCVDCLSHNLEIIIYDKEKLQVYQLLPGEREKKRLVLNANMIDEIISQEQANTRSNTQASSDTQKPSGPHQ